MTKFTVETTATVFFEIEAEDFDAAEIAADKIVSAMPDNATSEEVTKRMWYHAPKFNFERACDLLIHRQ